jgi:hypothetical protein
MNLPVVGLLAIIVKKGYPHNSFFPEAMHGCVRKGVGHILKPWAHDIKHGSYNTYIVLAYY